MEEFDNEVLFEELHKIDGIKEVLEYNKTEENLTDCEPFERLNQKFVMLQKQYADSFKALNKDIESKICKREYSKGGETLHRGFYSPSSLDLVVGGSCRGRLLKNTPKSNTYDYEYLFDDRDNIVCSKKYSDEFDGVFSVIAVELFVYEQNRVLAFEFNPYHNHALSFIAECQYENGRLTRYETAICELYSGGNGCTEINVETFEYADDLLESVCWYRYTPSIQLLDQNKFIFLRDEAGYLSMYTVEKLAGFARKDDFDHDLEHYRVKVKRR